MAAQVALLKGGVALGVAMHHAVVDGWSVWRFLQAWAAACRGEGDSDAAATPPPTFDRAVVKLPGGDEEEITTSVLHKYAPDLPKAAVAGFLIRPNVSRRTFTITAEQMRRRLKHRIVSDSDLSPSATTPSSFVAVAAHAWASFVRAKHAAGSIASPADDVYLFFFSDLRARMDPPLGDGYFGTCVSGCLATAAARDLLATDGVARAAAEEPLAGWEWMDTVSRLVDMDRLVNVAGSTRFPAYRATDFGWGQPGRTELVTMNNDGQVVLVAGGVQASVSLHPAHMDAYKAHFLSYLVG